MKQKITAALFLIFPIIASADGASGCGWGALLFDGNKGLPSHVLAVITNNTVFGNNTFGMSSGTNGCSTGDTIRYKGSVQLVSRNMDSLARDISRGQGETLTALAVVLEIKQQDRPLFYKTLQQNFAVIYPSEAVTSEEVLAKLISVMHETSKLAKYSEL